MIQRGAYADVLPDTTRGPRAGEQDGREYHFTTREAFENLVGEGGFIEHAQFGGNYYGTSVKTVEDIAKKGRVCILDIEMEVGVRPLSQLSTISFTFGGRGLAIAACSVFFLLREAEIMPAHSHQVC